MRSNMCCAGTLINYFSRWLDHWFQQLKSFITTYIKDIGEVLVKLKALWGFQILAVSAQVVKYELQPSLVVAPT